jgi:type IV secretion system protein VirB4
LLNLRSLVQAYDENIRSYADILPWFGQVTADLVLNLDGSLLAAFEYAGPEIESSDDVEADVVVESMETALRSFDDRNVFWSFGDKRRASYARVVTGTNPVARHVVQRWDEHVEGTAPRTLRHVFAVAYQPFSGGMGFFEEVASRAAVSDESFVRTMVAVGVERLSRKTQIERLEGNLDASIEAFEQQLRGFKTTLGAKVRLRRLAGGALLAELSNRANVATPRERVLVPPEGPVYLNTLLPTDTVRRGPRGTLIFDGATQAKVVTLHTIKGYGGYASNALVEDLFKTPYDFTITQMFRFLDKERAEKLIQDQEAHYRGNVKGPIVQAFEKMTGLQSDRVNHGMSALADDAQEALVESTAENVGFGYHTMVVQAVADSIQEADRASEALAGILTNAGYGLVRENVNLISAFSTTIPGAHDYVLRKTLLSTRNLADLTALRSMSAGPEENFYLSGHRGTFTGPLAVLPTTTDVPMRFHLHVGGAGHFFVVGPTRAGKTTLINFFIVCWQRFSPCRTIVIDKDYSHWITLNSLGGQYVDLRPGSRSARMSPARWCNADKPEDFHKLRRWLEVTLCAFDSTPLQPFDIKVMDRSIEVLAAQAGERSLSALHMIISGQDQALAARLAPWIKGGRYGDLFDHETDTFSLGDICGIEVGGLLSDTHLAPSVLAYLFEVIEEMVDNRAPTFIYLPEAWYMLKETTFRDRFEDYIKTMGKRAALVGIDTQSLKDLRDVPISATLNDNLKTRIFLPNVQAHSSGDIYRDMCGLRDDEIDRIRDAREKGEYYIVQGTERHMVDVTLPPEILAVTRSDVRAKDIFKRHLESGNPDWLANYVSEVTDE